MAQYINSNNNINTNSKITQTATSYVVLLSDNIIEVTSTAAIRTITLPAPSTTGATANAGKVYIVKDTSGAAATNNIVLSPASGNIDGSASVSIVNNFGWMAVFCDGTGWFVTSSSALPNSSVRQISAATYTALVSDAIIESNFGGAVTVTLPAPASTPSGKIFTIKDNSGLAFTNNITVKSASGNIDGTVGSTGLIIATNYGVLQVYNDGTNYYSIFATVNTATPSINIQTFTATGTYTPSANCQVAVLETVGGGAGGGGSNAPGANNAASGSGGGAGGYARSRASIATIGASQAVTIGAAGAGVSNAGGTAGGTTSIGALCASSGGAGGAVGTASGLGTYSFATGGAGGVGTIGTLLSNGMRGGNSFAFGIAANSFGYSGFGGSSMYGGGAAGVPLSGGGQTPGLGATLYGSGGSGSTSVSAGSAQAGGAGTAGIAVITEYIFAPPPLVTTASITWNTVPGASQTMATGNGYYCTNGGPISLSLPSVAAAGTVMAVVNVAAGLWTITQAAGQSIQYGAQVTTIGTGGNLTASATGNEVYLLCIVANTTWQVIDSVGNITVN